MELKLKLPTQSIELNPNQIFGISWLFLQGYSHNEFLVKAFLFLSGLRVQAWREPEPDGARWFVHNSLKKPFLIEADVLSEMAKQCTFLLTPEEVKPIRRIRFARARHFRLYNASFEEYLMAENYYFAYTETKHPEHLDNLIAVLYRLPWHRWNANKIQSRARWFRRVDPVIKNSVFMWYTGFRAFVPKRCPQLFTGKKSLKAFNPRNYINGMIHQLSNGDITIKNKLLQQSCWDALDELEQRAIEADEINKSN